MARRLQPVDISDMPEIRRLVDDVLQANSPQSLVVDKETVAVLAPARSRRRRSRATSAGDPLWNIVGIANSGGPGDVAENIDSYLAEAYAPREE